MHRELGLSYVRSIPALCWAFGDVWNPLRSRAFTPPNASYHSVVSGSRTAPELGIQGVVHSRLHMGTSYMALEERRRHLI